MRHVKHVGIRARDVDASGRVARASVALYFEEARDEWLEVVGGGPEVALAYLIRRIDITYERELAPEAGPVCVAIELEGLGTSSIRLRETLTAGPDDDVVARNSSVLVHVNRAGTASVPLPEDFRARLAAP
jgi:acyl-CoA thioesterase FadM